MTEGKPNFCSPDSGCNRKLRTQTSAAKALGISRQAVSKLIKNRERTNIPMHEDVGGVYFVCDELVQWYKSYTPRRGPKSKKS